MNWNWDTKLGQSRCWGNYLLGYLAYGRVIISAYDSHGNASLVGYPVTAA
jgi:hypothetical protein